MTGPHLYVLASSGTTRGRLTAASLRGPDGEIEVRTVDNTTEGLGSYLPPGGIAIPVRPLSPNTRYTASATFEANATGATPLTRQWSFSTGTRGAREQADAERSGISRGGSPSSGGSSSSVEVPASLSTTTVEVVPDQRALASPRLRITERTRRGSTVSVRGTIAGGTKGTVTVRATYKLRGRTHTVRARARAEGYRWAARLRIPARAKGTRIAARYGGGDRFAAAPTRSRSRTASEGGQT